MPSSLVLGTVGLLCKAYLRACTRLTVTNGEALLNAIHSRPAKKPLLTVANHTSTIDDPLMFGILPMSILFDSRRMRWSLGAKDIIFTNPLYTAFFSAGKVIPLERGGSIYQEAMERALGLLNSGEWVHIFPEGSVQQAPPLLKDRLKWGVGRLVMESKEAPILLPIVHKGFESVKPLDGCIRPLLQRIEITIGEPIDTALMRAQLHASTRLSPDERRAQATAYVRDQMQALY